jgi:hypothetical protein
VNYVFLRSVLRLLVTVNVVPSWPILVTLMMEVIHSSETSVRTRATWCNFTEDDILHMSISPSMISILYQLTEFHEIWDEFNANIVILYFSTLLRVTCSLLFVEAACRATQFVKTT